MRFALQFIQPPFCDTLAGDSHRAIWKHTVTQIRDHLMQLVLNLVFNAIDATSDKGLIRISAQLISDTRLQLTIADNGRGIRLVDQCRMFQPYFTTKPNGTGLGLYVCHQIVEDLGGTMRFETNEGAGTTFFLEFPVDQNWPKSQLK